MPTAKVDSIGSVGYIADKEASAIPLNAWNEMQNIRCKDGSISNAPGHAQIDTISITPDTIVPVKTQAKSYFVYAAGAAIYSYHAGTETDISGSTFSSGGWWDSCVLGGIGILNNFVDPPQYWGGSGNTVDLPYDTTGTNDCSWRDVNLRARVIREFKRHLFALDVDDGAGRNKRRVVWSHPAEPGTVPVTWDITNASYDAGDTELTLTPGAILDGLQLRDTFQIYKEDAIYAVTYTGDGNIWNFRPVVTGTGIYARNCVCDIGGQHFLVSDGDIFVYDGNNLVSIADKRVKDLFFSNVSRSYYDRTYCVYYHRTGEVWLNYPSANSSTCDQTLIWDVNENTWSHRECPNANCAVFAIVDQASDYTWATLPYATWSAWGITPSTPSWTTWAEPIDTSAIHDSLVLAGVQELLEVENGNQAKTTNMTCYARRTDIDLGSAGDWHDILKVYPHAEGDAFRVRVGSQSVREGSVSWSGYQTFTPGTDYELNFRVSGRFHAIEFSSAADVSWSVAGYEFDYEFLGRR